MLAFDLLTKAVAYAEDKFEGKDLSFAVTTNGSILREDIVEFCLAHKVNVLISIDGPKEIHDKNRRLADSDEGTFDLIMQNLQRVKATHPDFLAQVNINMVMDPRNDADCTNQLFAQYDIFARDRSAATAANTDFISDAFDATEKFLTKNTYHRFLAFMHHFGRVREDQVSTLQRTMVNRFLDNQERMAAYDSLPDVTAPGGPCLPGVVRPLVDVDGNIFPCERCSETAQVMCIGSLDRGFDLERAKAMMNIGALTQEDCRNCWAFSGCEICARSIEAGDVFSAEKKRQRCARLRNTMERDLLERIMLNEVKRGLNQPEEEIVHA